MGIAGFPPFLPDLTVPFNPSLVLEYGLSLVLFRSFVFQWIALLGTKPLNLRSMRNSTVFQLSTHVHPCCSPRCLWICPRKSRFQALHATSIPETDMWQIRTSIQIHTCHGIIHDGHANVDEEFIATEILPKVRSDSSIKPQAIEDHFKDVYGVKNQLPESLPSQRPCSPNHRRFARRNLRIQSSPTPHLAAPLYRITRSHNPKKTISKSCFRPLVVLPEGQESIEFVEHMMKFVQSVCSYVRGVMTLATGHSKRTCCAGINQQA